MPTASPACAVSRWTRCLTVNSQEEHGKIENHQVKSRIGSTERQCKNLDALGLKRINASVEHDDSVIIKGMIARVKHLVKVEEVAPAKKAAPKAKKAEVKEEAAQAAE